MKASELKDLVVDALEDMKGVDIQCLDVSALTEVMDYMIVATGTSNRHIRSLAENAAVKAKEKGLQPLGKEGDHTSDWVLVDFGDLVLHVMTADTRNLYDLESLWSESPSNREASGNMDQQSSSEG